MSAKGSLFLEDNIRKCLYDLAVGRKNLNIQQKALKANTDDLSVLNLRTSVIQKTVLLEFKGESGSARKYCRVYI